MKMINRYVTLALCFCISAPLMAQQKHHFTIENSHFVQVESQETGQNHELIIVLPPEYESSPGKTYPVLYFLDAYWDTPLLSAIYGHLKYDNVTQDFIMVGLSYPGRKVDYGRERLRDYTPTKEESDANSSGGAPAFLKFIKQSVIPLVESRYRASKSERALGGVSLGGLFTLYAMYQDPAFFGRYVAISPAVSWDNNHLFSTDEAYAKEHESLRARVFISYGTEEYPPFRDPIIQFQQKIAGRNYQGLELLNYEMKGLRHTTVKADGYTRGLIWAWQDIAPTGPSGLEKAYAEDQ